MKALTEINAEISTLQQPLAIGFFDDGLKRDEPKKSERNKQKKRLAFLFTVRNYLESSPSEQYCKDQIASLKALIRNISAATVPITFYPDNFDGDPAAYFNKKMGIDEMKEKIKTLEFIIS